jgi:cysteinyl-tRNA synthetase
MFPHHECEIAQARGATQCEFARHWMHTRHLLVNGAKMSKSAGTLLTLADIEAKGFTSLELRYLLITNHYRQQLNFTFEGLVAARSSIQRLQNARDTLVERSRGAGPGSAPSPAVSARIATFERDFGAGLDDDLNMSNAMAALFALAADIHRLDYTASDAALLLGVFDRADQVTGVLNRETGKVGVITFAELEGDSEATLEPSGLSALLAESTSVAQVKKLARARHTARRQKDWKTADAIRDHLKKSGVQFEDVADGVRYKLP